MFRVVETSLAAGYSISGPLRAWEGATCAPYPHWSTGSCLPAGMGPLPPPYMKIDADPKQSHGAGQGKPGPLPGGDAECRAWPSRPRPLCTGLAWEVAPGTPPAARAGPGPCSGMLISISRRYLEAEAELLHANFHTNSKWPASFPGWASSGLECLEGHWSFRNRKNKGKTGKKTKGG